jgi:hypothetical protein
MSGRAGKEPFIDYLGLLTKKRIIMLYGALIGAVVGLVGYGIAAIIKKNKKQ